MKKTLLWLIVILAFFIVGGIIAEAQSPPPSAPNLKRITVDETERHYEAGFNDEAEGRGEWSINDDYLDGQEDAKNQKRREHEERHESTE